MALKNSGHVNVFIAYSRKDVDYLNQLRTYLQPLHRNSTIKIWYDGEIAPGTSWEKEIKTHLHSADIVLLLVSADSLASDYFYDKEMAQALQRHHNGQTIVVPVILKDCAWELTDLHKLQALPQDGKPISSWESDSSAYANIVRGLYKSIDIVKEKKEKQTPVQAQNPIEESQPIGNEDNKHAPTFVFDKSTKKKALRILLPILVLMLFYFIARQCSPSDPALNEDVDAVYTQLIQQGDSLMAVENYADAEAIYQEALTKKPTGEEAILGLEQLRIATKVQYKIMGWHPYWMGNMIENDGYDNFTHISYFSYNVDPSTGGYSNPDVIKQLESFMAEENLKKQDRQFLLTITSDGLRKSEVLFRNRIGQQATLINTVLELIDKLDLNGVNLDFDFISKNYDRAMVSFVKEFSNRLKAIDTNHILSLNLPYAYKEEGGYSDINELNSYVDLFIMEGYGFYDGESKKDGAISPLNAPGDELSLTSVVDAMLEDEIEPSKIILGLPYYGSLWGCTNDSISNAGCTFKNHVTYNEIINSYTESKTPIYDQLSQSAYFVKKIKNNEYEKVWFEDAKTLKIKYEWIKRKGLGGVAIWALGYEGKQQELNDVLEESFK